MAVDAGMTGSEFWNSSLPEINDVLDSATRRRKEKINFLFMLAEIISNRTMRDEKTPVLHQWDYYPAMFEEDRIRYEEFQRKEELETYKENRRRAFGRHNAMRSRQEVIE